MIVVLPFSARDHQLARKLAKWLVQVGPYPGHRAMIVKDSRIDDGHQIAQTLLECFDSVQEVVYPDDNRNEWPFSANRMFNRAAKEIEYSAQPEPWLWLEPDAVPLRKGWLDELIAEYNLAKKPFMGDEVNVNGVPLHMSGIGFYPPQISQHAYEAPMASETAWDVAAAHQIVPKAHWTERIVHNWKHEPVDTADKLANLRGQHPKMVLFHSDKSGAMIDLLEQELLPDVPPETVESATSDKPWVQSGGTVDEVLSVRSSSVGQHVSGPTGPTDLFIKTYPEDFGWLVYCLKSIQKFATGFRKIVVVSPVPIPAVDNQRDITYIEAGEQPDGYLWQQVIKLNADKFTDAENICFIDSDTIFIRPVRPDMFFRNGRPIWMMTPYSQIDVPWKPIIEKFMKGRVEIEFMRRFPMMIPRWLLANLRAFCEREHGVSLDMYILNQPKSAFSEFNALGAFAFAYHNSKFEWINTELTPPEQWPITTVKQSWSKGGLTEKIKQDYNEILSGGSVETIIPSSVSSTAGPSPKISFEERSHEIAEAEQRKAITREVVEKEHGLVCGKKIPAQGGVQPLNGIRQTKEGWWVLEKDAFISKWVEEEGRLDHDQWLLQRLGPLVKQGDTVIEAGAYIGDHTKWFMDHGCGVIAFEPNPAAFECLKRNCPGALLHPQALWREPALLEFEREVADNPGANWVVEHYKGRPIEAIPLDHEQFNRVDLIMIDVEGSELFVLQGAEKTIQKHRPKLVIELNAGAMKRQGYDQQSIFTWLRQHGYEWEAIQPMMVADPPQYDIVARPKNVTNVTDNGQKPAQPAQLEDIIGAVNLLKDFADRDTSSRMKVMFRLSRAGLVPRMPNQRKYQKRYKQKKKQREEKILTQNVNET